MNAFSFAPPLPLERYRGVNPVFRRNRFRTLTDSGVLLAGLDHFKRGFHNTDTYNRLRTGDASAVVSEAENVTRTTHPRITGRRIINFNFRILNRRRLKLLPRLRHFLRLLNRSALFLFWP